MSRRPGSSGGERSRPDNPGEEPGRTRGHEGQRPLESLEQSLGVRLSDRGLLEQALTHRSYAFEAGGLPTNERLEFLGDAVLGLVVSGLIFHAYPEAPEGRLAKLRAAAVNTQSLARLARSVGIGEHVRLGRGEEQSGGRDKDSILADTTEALLGAVYLDQGMWVASELITRLFSGLLTEIATRGESLDAKTSLQELCAASYGTLPSYQLSEEGPDHRKRFTARVTVAGRMLGEGAGRNKKEAEQAAAARALAALRREFAVTSDADG
jgi:ribonuclease III